MNKLSKYIQMGLFVCFGFCQANVSGQAKDIDRFFDLINNAQEVSSLSCVIECKIFNDLKDSNPYVVSKGTYYVLNKDYNYRLGDEQLIKKGDKKLLISFKEKQIFLQNDHQDISPDIGSQLTEYLKKNISINLLSVKNGIEKYEIMAGENSYFPFDRIVIDFDLHTNFYKRIQLDYKEEKGVSEYSTKTDTPRIIINYSDIEVDKKISLKKFDFSKYITESNGKVFLTPSYSDFKLHNQLLTLE